MRPPGTPGNGETRFGPQVPWGPAGLSPYSSQVPWRLAVLSRLNPQVPLGHAGVRPFGPQVPRGLTRPRNISPEVPLGLAGLGHFSPQVPWAVARLSRFSPQVPWGLAGLSLSNPTLPLGYAGNWVLQNGWYSRDFNGYFYPSTGRLKKKGRRKKGADASLTESRRLVLLYSDDLAKFLDRPTCCCSRYVRRRYRCSCIPGTVTAAVFRFTRQKAGVQMKRAP